MPESLNLLTTIKQFLYQQFNKEKNDAWFITNTMFDEIEHELIFLFKENIKLKGKFNENLLVN